MRDIGKLKEPFQSSIRELIKHAKEQGIPIYITNTTRTLKEQKELVKKGFSKTLKSKHLIGEAADIAFKVNGKLSYSSGLYEKLYREVVKDLPYVIWPFRDLGWDWDRPHFQYDKNKKAGILTTMEKEEYEIKIRALNTEIGEVTRARDVFSKYKKRYYDEVKSHKSTIDHLEGCETELNRISEQKNKATSILDRIKTFFS